MGKTNVPRQFQSHRIEKSSQHWKKSMLKTNSHHRQGQQNGAILVQIHTQHIEPTNDINQPSSALTTLATTHPYQTQKIEPHIMEYMRHQTALINQLLAHLEIKWDTDANKQKLPTETVDTLPRDNILASTSLPQISQPIRNDDQLST